MEKKIIAALALSLTGFLWLSCTIDGEDDIIMKIANERRSAVESLQIYYEEDVSSDIPVVAGAAGTKTKRVDLLKGFKYNTHNYTIHPPLSLVGKELEIYVKAAEGDTIKSLTPEGKDSRKIPAPVTGGELVISVVASATGKIGRTYTVTICSNIGSGGDLSFVNLGGGKYDEVHVFKFDETNAVDNKTILDFKNYLSIGSANMLLIGGGGGGGGGIYGAGGGAGQLLTGQMAFPAYNYTVTVGGGGKGGLLSSNFQGSRGGDSTVGVAIAYGGGGGGAIRNSTSESTATSGGSGGGAAKAGNEDPGKIEDYTPAAGFTYFGNAGGKGFSSGDSGSGGGGGGAGGIGGNAISGTGGTGGTGKGVSVLDILSGLDTEALKAILGNETTVAGGGTGYPNGLSSRDGAANTGTGGSGFGGINEQDGGAGGSGVVIIRFPAGFEDVAPAVQSGEPATQGE
ncbi:MAG: hypothetical protein LBC77_07160 [Spirochaetaceae bacterium]|jgi:hypothetical protein|nr:hypothetical protein [Spirochaetaceae bacterium]